MFEVVLFDVHRELAIIRHDQTPFGRQGIAHVSDFDVNRDDLDNEIRVNKADDAGAKFRSPGELSLERVKA